MLSDLQDSPAEDFLRNLGENAIAELSKVYESVVSCSEGSELTDWLNRAPMEKQGLPLYRHIWFFLLVCELLHDRKMPPFHMVHLQRFPPPPAGLRWCKLPSECRYLARPAEKYGMIQFGEQLEFFRRYATGEELASLAKVASLANGDMHLLVDWMSRHSLAEHPEADLIHFLLILLSELELT